MTKKYRTIYESLRRDIGEGRYAEGALLPTEKELTAQFGASRPTVAKALEMLRLEGAISRTPGFGTVVLESRLTRGIRIGLLIPRLGVTEIFEPICQAIEDEGEKLHWHLVRPTGTGGTQSIDALTERLCERFIREKVEGVFFTPVEHIEKSEPFNRSIVERLKVEGIATVLLDRDMIAWPGQTPYDLISIDNIEAGYVVGAHLVERGCQRIVFATRASPAMTVQLRVMGCREAALQAGLPAEAVIVQDVREDNGADAVDSIMAHRPDGLVCANDATAATLMRQVLDAGVSIPGQLRVAGFDDVRYASLLSIPLTTYQQPCEDIGRSAVEAMHFRIQHRDAAPRRITLQGQLVPRSSTE